MNKKHIIIILSVLIVLLLTACGQAPDSTAESTPTGESFINGGLEDNVYEQYFAQESGSPSEPTDPQDITEDVPPEETETSDHETEPSAPVETDPPAEGGDTPNFAMTYEKFNALSPKEKRLFQESFDDIDAFFDWYEAVKAEYEKENPPIIIDGDGTIILP